jgi:transglycosylase-like protein with SLT domain
MTDSINLSWDAEPARRTWSAELAAAISDRLKELEDGNPEQFVAGYTALPRTGRLRYWGELIVAMAKFESNWRPDVVFHEPPPLGVDSVGLLQLSYEDEPIYKLEPLDRGRKTLEDPLVNLRCGVKILATLLTRDKVVAASAGTQHHGGARYWSVLRPGPKHHLEEIKSLVRKHAVP